MLACLIEVSPFILPLSFLLLRIQVKAGAAAMLQLHEAKEITETTGC